MTKASLCIPMTLGHIKWIDNLFHSISQYTVLPEEIVMSISDVEDPQACAFIVKSAYEKYGLNGKVVLSLSLTNKKLLAGGNRNVCIDSAKNDLLIFHDADDIAHPDRVKILKHIFEHNPDLVSINQNYAANHKNNGSYDSLPWKDYEASKISLYFYTDIEMYKNTKAAAGVPAFRKSKIGNIRYKENVQEYLVAEDQDFIIEIIKQVGNCAFVKEELYEYRIGDNLHGRIANKKMEKIDRKIYCFWFGPEPSEDRKKCFESMVKNSGVSVQLITENNLINFIAPENPIHPAFKYLSATHKADYLRVYFMYNHGGGYSDIKFCGFNWQTFFNILEISNKQFIGYPEKGEGDIGDPTIRHLFDRLVGNGYYIFKKKTPFAKAWLDATNKKMDLVAEQLEMYPGDYHPRAIKGGIAFGNPDGSCLETDSKYPLEWNELLGRIFHKLSSENLDAYIIGMPRIFLGRYR